MVPIYYNPLKRENNIPGADDWQEIKEMIVPSKAQVESVLSWYRSLEQKYGPELAYRELRMAIIGYFIVGKWTAHVTCLLALHKLSQGESK